MAAKKKRSRGLGGTPYQHKQEADYFFDETEKVLTHFDRHLSSGDCRNAFVKLEDAIGTYSVAVNNRVEALTSIGASESSKAAWKTSLDERASRLGDKQMKASEQFAQKCIIKTPLSGTRRKSRR